MWWQVALGSTYLALQVGLGEATGVAKAAARRCLAICGFSRGGNRLPPPPGFARRCCSSPPPPRQSLNYSIYMRVCVLV